MIRKILISGSSGLVGTALASALVKRGINVAQVDIHANGAAHGDVRDRERMRKAIEGAQGIVHLAAVSRVIWGERDP
ncbi:MAG TPA: NAD-dependent epimerase/dehydratase family protein, partial [Polyangium sp.]|nr:NAD-dependent epimerase/dehydratase family protein [Polyangium sp.]